MQTETEQGTRGADMPPRWPRRPSSVLAGSREGLAAVTAALTGAVGSALAVARWPSGPLRGGAPEEVLAAARAALGKDGVPEEGMGAEAALGRLGRVLVEYGLHLSHAHAVAHLQPPPLAVAVAADALASASNASLDTYDSGPSAIAIERWLIHGLLGLAGLGAKADGVLTPGGSLSNLMGLMLARDAAALRRGIDTRRQGVGALMNPVVLCSELAHFSVHRACAALGLGENAVRPVPTDSRRRIRTDALVTILRELPADATPLAIVATAGTTDFGSVDPLHAIADIAAERGIWLHVDAAYGFGALFSDRLKGRVDGISRADSITLDLHKLGWQPAATSVLLVSDAAAFAALDRQVAYLNPEDDSEAGYDGLLGRSLQTTRRPDAVKVAATLLAHGRRGLGDMVDTCHDLARHAEARILSEPELELVAPAELTTVVFRYRVPEAPAREDEINGALRRRLLESGAALIGRTAVRLDGPGSPERVCLKFTLLNPTTTPEDIDALVHTVLEAGRALSPRLQKGAA
jgi:L-2,4-diaminobutyrate decarboxylase